MTHPNEVRLVNDDGTMTTEGAKLLLEFSKKYKGDVRKSEACLEQSLRQEVYGAPVSK